MKETIIVNNIKVDKISYENWLKIQQQCLHCKKPISYERRFKTYCNKSCGAKSKNHIIQVVTKWTQQELDKLKALYPISEDWNFLLKEFPNSTKRGIQTQASKLNIKKIKIKELRHKPSCNDNLFSTWNEKSTYILGFLEADGHFKDNGFSLKIPFHLSYKDKEFIYKLKEWVEHPKEPKIQYHHNKSNGKTYKGFRFIVSSRQWRKDLLGKYRIGKIADCIPKELWRHYIRGLWDGDGCYYFSKQALNIQSNLVASSITLLESVVDKLKELGINSKFTIKQKINSKKCWYIQLAHHATIKLANLLYKDANFYLDRKYNIIKNLLIKI